jgi:hypothetical protein
MCYLLKCTPLSQIDVLFVLCRMLEKHGEKGEPWTEVLSWEPQALMYHNFLLSVLHHSIFGSRANGCNFRRFIGHMM